MNKFSIPFVAWMGLALGLVPLASFSAWLRAEPFADAAIQPIATTIRFTDTRTQGQEPFAWDRELSASAVVVARCERQANKLGLELPETTHVVIHPPFVLAGDLSRFELEGWFHRSIVPAVVAINHTYGQKLPDQPVSIVLMREEEGYRASVARLFDRDDVSIYGFFHPRDRILVVHLGGGGGTLIHELTHALVLADFPRAPLWLNEGLASLHEACDILLESSGPSIRPRLNWRLATLRSHLARGTLPSVASLVEDDAFRHERAGLDYAMARYWCLYLDELGLLRKGYARMRERAVEETSNSPRPTDMLPNTPISRVDANFRSWLARKSTSTSP